MSYDYAGYQTALVTLMATTTEDPYFVTILPDIIDYAELRIYQELDLLNTRFRDATSTTAIGSRQVSLPATLIVLETLAIISPAGSTTATSGARRICQAVTHDFIDMIYPSDGVAYQATPQFFAMLTQTTVLLGPCPDGVYGIEITGTSRPAPLSDDNTTTMLTEMLPALFLAASMVFASGYQKNFGSQADDPKMATSWETQYKELMQYAKSEEFRKKMQSSSWTSQINPTSVDKQRG
ncbi:hypothetical protein ACELLULO517_07780 [Acidisoma cellulosilytica]|uniref:Uncharacterized protein n=1 Tax=Acidisoma cellulosilyticum TaxID=2802395 RepID=A0A963YZV3_9PROT|nr:hypothetical protein [Acidisoma cellulosilyticum]MCB8880131.1 hypothetical protein [Acidisoma cellulosilyticum]